MLRRATARTSSPTHHAKVPVAAPLSTAPLPEPKTITIDKCIIEYTDSPCLEPLDSKAPITVVFIPGSPGTYRDFRYLTPLMTHRARVVSVNMPGFGESRALDNRDRYTMVGSSPAANAVHEALKMVCKDDPNVFVVGHSFGGHTAISITKMSVDQNLPSVKGLGLLASASYCPHQTLYPRTVSVMAWLIKAGIPLISWCMTSLLRMIMTSIIGFPRGQPDSYYVSSIVRQTTTDYGAVMQDADALKQLPTFHAWSRNDFHIQEKLSLHLNERVGNGPRISFERGGHNIQKTRATVLAQELFQWMESVVEGVPAGTNMKALD